MGQKGLKQALLVVAALAAMLTWEAPAEARHRMSFTPGQHQGWSNAPRRSWHRSSRGRHRGYRHVGRRGRAPASQNASTPTSVPPGFKMEDGVLTYPAPARFQPKNLKHM